MTCERSTPGVEAVQITLEWAAESAREPVCCAGLSWAVAVPVDTQNQRGVEGHAAGNPGTPAQPGENLSGETDDAAGIKPGRWFCVSADRPLPDGGQPPGKKGCAATPAGVRRPNRERVSRGMKTPGASSTENGVTAGETAAVPTGSGRSKRLGPGRAPAADADPAAVPLPDGPARQRSGGRCAFSCGRRGPGAGLPGASRSGAFPCGRG